MTTEKITIYRANENFDLRFDPIEETMKVKKLKDGYEVKYLIQDEGGESPDNWGDESLFLVNYHRDFHVENKEVISEDEVRAYYQGEKIEQVKEYRIFFLTSYIHSGVTLYLGESSNPSGVGYGHFDTSHVGLVFASKKEFPQLKDAEKAVEGLIETWNKYLHGDVYCLVRENFDLEKNYQEHDTLGGCYGFEDAKSALETEI